MALRQLQLLLTFGYIKKCGNHNRGLELTFISSTYFAFCNNSF